MGKAVATLIKLGRHSQKSSSIVLGYVEAGHADAKRNDGHDQAFRNVKPHLTAGDGWLALGRAKDDLCQLA
jgi:hypothetical protein